MEKYNPAKIEPKWQKKWEESGIYRTHDFSKKPKFYALDMFPYPSGAGLHVGHPKGYIATDVSSRKKMLEGYNVLHPMGWDAFGLPAENYAIKNKIHPRISTKKNVAVFKKQLEKFGFTYDWDREINTTDPEFYKWTQWIFLKMFEKGLAYESDEPVNWCPSCKTVLANEDLEGGLCERCGAQVVQKKMKQWVLKMTAYADRLLYDLDKKDLDWEELIKEQQRNWIGRSEGAEVEFPIVIASPAQAGRGNLVDSAKNSGLLRRSVPRDDSNIKVYTTRLDTIFGCTYCVIAPEHSLIQDLKEKIENYSEVEKYVIAAQNKTNLERTELQKEKTGVELKGIRAINPFTNEEIPVWVADYVLGFYGTGAVMAVPAHDERDFEFAKKYGLPIRIVVKEKEQYEDVNQERLKKFLKEIFEYKEKNIFFAVLIGGMAKKIVENDKNYIPSDLDLYVDQKGFDLITDYLKDKGYKEEELSKEDYGWQHAKSLYSNNGNWIDLFLIEKEGDVYFDMETGKRFEWGSEKVFQTVKIDNTSITVPNKELLDRVYFNTTSTGKRCLTKDGILTRSEIYNGLTSEKAREEMAKWLEEKGIGKRKVNYKMRDWVFSRQRYWGEPFPLIFCEHCKKEIEKTGNAKISLNPSLQKRETNQCPPFFKGGQGDFSQGELLNPGWIAINEKDMPIRLPEIESYEPTGTGESPLANIKEWVNTKCPKCGGLGRRETNTMPQWAGSSWYYLRYIDPKNKKSLIDKEKEKYWMPVDLYVGGAEHATRHLLYARFWHKFLYDIGVVSGKEPFKKLVHVGLINAEDGRKMSKRWRNVINPDDMIAEYGADAVRLYEMFMGPFTQNIVWSTKGVNGMRRFLERIWSLNPKSQTPNSKQIPNSKSKNSNDLERLLHKTIKKVTEDIDNFKFNTAISALMVLSNEFEKQENLSKDYYEKFLVLVSPFAPHIAEELWYNFGNRKSIFFESWPKYDPELVKEEEIDLVVQINGKLKNRIKVSADISEEEAKKAAMESEKVKKAVEGKEIKKVIFVKGRLINLVI